VRGRFVNQHYQTLKLHTIAPPSIFYLESSICTHFPRCAVAQSVAEIVTVAEIYAKNLDHLLPGEIRAVIGRIQTLHSVNPPL